MRRPSTVLFLVVVLALMSVVDGLVRPASAAGGAVCSDVVYTPPTSSRPQGATLCEPPSGTTRSTTAVVLIHGGGGSQGSRSDLRAWQEQHASNGVVTLAIDYALLGEGDDDLYPLAEQQAKAAVQYVRLRSGELGVDQVVVQGHSAGARLAAIVATSAGDAEFLGPELWLGVSDAVDGFIGLYGYYDGGQYDAERYFGEGDRAFDVVDRAAQATGPVLLVHGTDDGVVSASQSQDLVDALAGARRSVRLELVDGAGHGFDGYEHDELSGEGLRIATRIAGWLDRLPSLAGDARS